MFIVIKAFEKTEKVIAPEKTITFWKCTEIGGKIWLDKSNHFTCKIAMCSEDSTETKISK